MHRVQVFRGDDVVEAAVAETLVQRVDVTVAPLIAEYVYHSSVTQTLQNLERCGPPAVADSRVLVVDVCGSLPVGQLLIWRVEVAGENPQSLWPVPDPVEDGLEDLDLLFTFHPSWDGADVPDFNLFPAEHAGRHQDFLGVVRREMLAILIVVRLVEQL